MKRLWQIVAHLVRSWWQPQSGSHGRWDPKSRFRRHIRLEALETRLALTGYTVDLSLSLTKPDGSALSSLSAGDDFVLHFIAQDLRDDPHGVFAAYADVTWDPSLAIVTGPIQYGTNYPNGKSGTPSAGLIDEAGAFATGSGLDGGSYEVFRVAMRATGGGRLSFAINPADVVPQHAILVLGSNDVVANDAIHYETTAIDVSGSSSGGGAPIAVDDFVHATAGTSTVLDVLSNDIGGQGGFTITAIGMPSHGTASDNGGTILYRAASGFSGADSFTYTVRDGSGHSATATVSVTVDPDTDRVAPHVDFDLTITRPDGSPATSLQPGDDVVLHVLTQDKTPFARGVFAAYLDITWDSRLATITGPLKYGVNYQSGRSGDATVPGLLDEAGGFAQNWLDGQVYEVFSVPMRAAAAGNLVFRSDPADQSPIHDVLVSGFNSAVSDSDISFGSASIVIGTPVTSDAPVLKPDMISVPSDGTQTMLDVLANDKGGGPGDHLTIVSVTQPAAGTVSIAPDGQHLLFDNAFGYSGAVTFSYGVTNSAGDLASADVTLDVGAGSEPGVTLDGSVLRITGSDQHDVISVFAGRRVLLVMGMIGDTPVRESFRVGNVQRIEAALGGGDDLLSIAGNVRAAVLADGGEGNDTMIAGGGSAVLLGSGGNDRLIGGIRRDVIIGGAGQDQISGGGESDILIGGTTAYDGDPAALLAIQAQWNVRAPRASRIASLRDGTGSVVQPLGISLQKDVTVLDDGEVDAVFGMGNVDWVFGEAGASAMGFVRVKRGGW